MAADDSTEPVAFVPETVRSDERVTLPDSALDWLAARVGSSSDEVLVSVIALPGRWLLRVASGPVCSAFEHPARHTTSATDLASEVRRWAHGVGHSARVEEHAASEVRLSVSPAPPKHS